MEITYVKVNTRITIKWLSLCGPGILQSQSIAPRGTFVFPIPSAHYRQIHDGKSDGKQAEAELLSADKARHIYEDIVRQT